MSQSAVRFSIYPFGVGVEGRRSSTYMPERYDMVNVHAVNVIEVMPANKPKLTEEQANALAKFLYGEKDVNAFAAAGRGHGQVVGIVGEPGVGKSRLVWELAHSSGTQGWLILQSGAASYGKATPYLPVIDLIKALPDDLRIEREDGCRPVSRRIRMGHASADCSFITHLHVTELSRCLRQEWAGAAEKIRGLHLEVRGHGADAELPGFFLNIGELLDAAQVNENFGLHQTQLHGGQQAMSAGQNFGVVFVRGQE
jgi:hypothetical protein